MLEQIEIFLLQTDQDIYVFRYWTRYLCFQYNPFRYIIPIRFKLE